ncbi:MAG: S1-like domain-containing RNA-binding protein [Bacteroidota bacterium]|nr:S1-like domain-containing RNA-binding protein [Bacteroidota bacterium]
MVNIGKINNLEVVKELDFGIYLNGEELGEILLPRRYVPKDTKPGDKLDVFIYLDSEDRLIATTEKPFAMVDEFALLRVVSVNDVGAFLDWGLMKDLLVPYSEQKMKMRPDHWYMVKVYLDKITKRIVASAKLDSFLDNLPPDYEFGQEVNIIVHTETDLGYKAIVNGLHWGMLYKNEVFQDLEQGQRIKAFVKKIREDDKIDLCLHKPGYDKIKDISEQILDYIKKNKGFLPITDKSSPETIYGLFGVSKKAYKNAIGNLYRKKLIVLEENGVRLAHVPNE